MAETKKSTRRRSTKNKASAEPEVVDETQEPAGDESEESAPEPTDSVETATEPTESESDASTDAGDEKPAEDGDDQLSAEALAAIREERRAAAAEAEAEAAKGREKILASRPGPRDMVTAVLVDGRKAILAGRSVLQNERHRVMYAQYRAAWQRNKTAWQVRYEGSDEFIVEEF